MRYLIFILFLTPLIVQGQVIQSNPNGTTVIGDRVMSGPSVILEAKSTTRGFLPPRMTTTQRNAMTALEGLTIYNTSTKTMEHYNGTSWVNESSDTLCMIIACSDETTDLTTGTKVTFRAPFRMNLVLLRANVNTAPTGVNGVIVNILENNNTIMTGAKLTINPDQKTSTTDPTITDTDIADNAECTIGIDQVGSTAAGKGLKVHIYYTKLY